MYKRQVCAFGAAATAPVATCLLNPEIGALEAALSVLYGLIVGALIGAVVIRIDLFLTGSPATGTRRRPSGRRAAIDMAEDEGAIVGFSYLGPSRDEDAERTTMEIYAIYLDPHAWGRGVARELMRTTLAAVPDGAAVTLWALDANERARHFYRRNGFVPDGVEKMEEFGGEYLKEVRYRRG